METEVFQEVASQQILQLAQEEEAKLDREIQKLETLDEDDFDKLRQRRLEKLKKAEQQKHIYKQLGHGEYAELASQQEFFDAAKHSPRVVCHFYRPTAKYCQVVDFHMARLAARHIETRFCKINAEKSPYLVEKLNVYMMPTIVCIKDQKTTHHIKGLDELGGTDEFSSDMFAYVLSSHNVLNYDGGRPDSPTQAAKKKGVNSIRMAMTGPGGLAPGRRGGTSSIRDGLTETQYDSDGSAEDDIF